MHHPTPEHPSLSPHNPDGGNGTRLGAGRRDGGGGTVRRRSGCARGGSGDRHRRGGDQRPGIQHTLTFLGVTGLVVPAFRVVRASPILGFFCAGVVHTPLNLLRPKHIAIHVG